MVLNWKNKCFYILLTTVVYVGWAVSFIYKSSLVALNGQRYFCLFDDAMISMRYAWNLSHGNGLVWNPGEYVEGITNMLMTLYMSVFTLLFDKNTAVFMIQVTGIVFMLMIAFLCMKIGELVMEKHHINNPGFFLPLFFAIPLCYYPLSFWTLLGMENGMLMVLLLSATLAAMRMEGNPLIKPIFPILLGLAFLTRPDAMIPVALILLYRWTGIARQKGWFRTIGIEAGIVASFVVGITLFRYLYYGSPVPNTYLLKVVGVPLGEKIKNGIIFITPFIKLMWFPICIAVFSVLVNMTRIAVLIFGMMAAAIGYQVYVGGDFFVYWRMLSPYVPLLLILCLVEIAAVASTRIHPRNREETPGETTGSARFFSPQRTRNAIVMAAFLVFLVRLNIAYHQEVLLKHAASVEANKQNIKVALALEDITTKDASVGVSWAGTIPYYTGRKAVDFLGKSDRYIASLSPDMSGSYPMYGMTSVPGHNKYDLEYSIVKLKP
ncbi:MAG: hypothetical protein GY940_37390, partial [bacterium]|nr:hypothetical protein [bacterium]